MLKISLMAALCLGSVSALAQASNYECLNGNYVYEISVKSDGSASATIADPHLGQAPSSQGNCFNASLANSVAVSCTSSSGTWTVLIDKASGNYSETSTNSTGKVFYTGAHTAGTPDDGCTLK